MVIIQNFSGKFEIRKGIFDYRYYDQDYRNGYWWPDRYRENSTKYASIEAAEHAVFKIKTKDRVVKHV